MKTTPFVNQLFIAAAPMLAALSVGGAVSFPTVLIYQLKSNDTSIELDLNTVSWIGSIHGLVGIPSMFSPIIMQWQGRKFAFIIACIVNIIGWIVAYTASTTTAIFISESLHGFSGNSILAVSYFCISEMISADYRLSYMQMYGMLQVSTMALNGLLIQYLHWKTISIVMCIPMMGAGLLACFWPESPHWLAMKGKYVQCETSFTWLRGTDVVSKKELDLLIRTQKERTIKNKTRKNNIIFKNIRDTITVKTFYLPFFHTFVLQYLFYWSGNYVISIYSIELIQKVTQNESVSIYGGLIMNGILCLGFVICVVLNRHYKRKSILLWCTAAIVLAMFSATVVTYLQSIGSLRQDSNLCFYCLVAYMIANGIGIVPIAYDIAIEIMPVKHRGIGGALIVACSCLLHSSSLKISPYLFLYINLWGTFLFYTINSIVCGLIIWKYVPETKDRTLNEIANFYLCGKFSDEILLYDSNYESECQYVTEPIVKNENVKLEPITV